MKHTIDVYTLKQVIRSVEGGMERGDGRPPFVLVGAKRRGDATYKQVVWAVMVLRERHNAAREGRRPLYIPEPTRRDGIRMGRDLTPREDDGG